MSDRTVKAMSAAYVALLALSPARRVYIQDELSMLRDAIAAETDEDAEETQDMHEKKAFLSPLRAQWMGTP